MAEMRQGSILGNVGGGYRGHGRLAPAGSAGTTARRVAGQVTIGMAQPLNACALMWRGRSSGAMGCALGTFVYRTIEPGDLGQIRLGTGRLVSISLFVFGGVNGAQALRGVTIFPLPVLLILILVILLPELARWPPDTPMPAAVRQPASGGAVGMGRPAAARPEFPRCGGQGPSVIRMPGGRVSRVAAAADRAGFPAPSTAPASLDHCHGVPYEMAHEAGVV